MDEQQLKTHIRNTFDTVAEGYGSTGMEFFHKAAAHLSSVFALQGHEQLLDVATGTGIAATALATHVPQGKVTGIDLSEGMLAQARARAQALGLGNVELHAMDMQGIGFDDASFDSANCSFGLFFLPDMDSLLKHIVSKVKPGGQVVTCSFYQGSFEPLVDLFLERIQRYGVNPPEFTWRQFCLEEHYHALYARAGLTDVLTHRQTSAPCSTMPKPGGASSGTPVSEAWSRSWARPNSPVSSRTTSPKSAPCTTGRASRSTLPPCLPAGAWLEQRP